MLLKGKKCILRKTVQSDAQRFFEWLSDETLNSFVLRKKITYEDTVAWMKQLLEKKNEIHCAIDTKEGVHIGCVSLKVQPDDRVAELALLIGEKEYWGKGLGSEASELMIQYAFEELHLHKVWLSVYEYNTRALSLYKKLGFIQEGELREQIYYKDRYYNEIYMGLLASEWHMR